MQRNESSPRWRKALLVWGGGDTQKAPHTTRRASLQLGRTRHIHLVAIGGIGMSGIAEILVNSGFTVTGSDLADGALMERLRGLGVRCDVGHRAEQIKGANVVVYSSAVPDTNPELVHARELGIPVITRGEMLAELMRLKQGIAITGSHGKTSTSSLVAEILNAGDLDPTAVVGGRLLSFGSNARLGLSNFMVAEADESDGSFLRLAPVWAILTNVDHEHLDHYGSFERLQDSFVAFLNELPFYGAAIICIDDPVIRELRPRLQGRIITYGLSADADVRGLILEQSSAGSRIRWETNGLKCEMDVPLIGTHNVLNALAAVAIGLELNLPLLSIQKGFTGYRGVGRRFEKKGEVDGVMVMDDYGHHPTEIIHTLRAAREHFKRRLHAVFQPHRYTRTQALADEFASAFDDADTVIVTEIYEASEKPIPGITPAMLVKKITDTGHGDVRHISDREELAAHLLQVVESGDIVITLGAGNLNSFADDLVERLQCRLTSNAGTGES
ncbi:MAG: UDP-N-acetylmuramate--L-alanine ligase [bacterium]|nr:UDP-N-acetylmuramate--L-alanine ligase [bacterium]